MTVSFLLKVLDFYYFLMLYTTGSVEVNFLRSAAPLAGLCVGSEQEGAGRQPEVGWEEMG